MSIQQQIEELDLDPESLADDLVKGTLPGESNEPYYRGLGKAVNVVPRVIDDLNNWFYIVDVRVHDSDHIAIPMRYRWSIIRWAHNDMDKWLMENGWQDLAHLNADSRSRREDEIEARYRKEFDGVTVDCNFMVLFPDIVFKKMNDGDLERINERKMKEEEKSNTIEDVIEERRKGNV